MKNKKKTSSSLSSANTTIESRGDTNIDGDLIGRDKTINSTNNYNVDGTLIQTQGGDYANSIDKRQGTFIEFNFKSVIEFFPNLLRSYIQIFVGVIGSPNSAFEDLVGSKSSKKYKIINSSWDERPILFVIISLIIGNSLARTFSIQGAPTNYSWNTLSSLITSYLVLWVVYGISIHVGSRILKGQGHILQTVTGTLYVLGALHVLLILFIYFMAAAFPSTFEYKYALTLRDINEYGSIRTISVPSESLNFLGINFTSLYYIVSTVLTVFYLYFPLKIIHKLSIWEIALLYIIGIGVIIVFFIIGVGAFLGLVFASIVGDYLGFAIALGVITLLIIGFIWIKKRRSKTDSS